MNDLIQINSSGQAVASSRDIAEHFGKRTDHVLRDIDALKKDVPNFGGMFFEAELPDSYGRPQRAYFMNRDGFSLLAMGFTGKAALEWKVKYIAAFNAMDRTISDRLPQDYPSALRALADAEEKRLALQAKSEADAPKVLFADAVSASHTSILVGDLAKLLRQNGISIGQNRLFQRLRDEGYLIKHGERRNMPTQRYMDSGLFQIKETSINNPDGSIRVTRTVKVTGKGQQYFINRYLAGN
ncbi:phage regulatory protein/antirepressor Ant [Oscillibacter ruminantium]|uniref:phage regulatory protein/antirepressor Ant n=1 Tax=Oscillibacter ruminantium TaxID=1263547 RepID=UPI00332072F5